MMLSDSELANNPWDALSLVANYDNGQDVFGYRFNDDDYEGWLPEAAEVDDKDPTRWMPKAKSLDMSEFAFSLRPSGD